MRFARSLIVIWALAMLPRATTSAQDLDAGSPDTPTEANEPADKKASLVEFSLIQRLPRYEGDLWTREALTGDWGGARTELAENGIVFDLRVTQILQANTRGGKDTNSSLRYSGSADYTIKLDTARMGLWPAGMLYLKGETMFGRSVNGKVGSLMAPNADALFPVPDDPGKTTLTDVVYTQFLSDNFGFALGKIDFRGGDQNVFAHDENTQFMNLAFVANPTLLIYAPYTALNASFFYRPADWLTAAFSVFDTYGTATRSGFDTAFHSPQGTSFLGELTFNVNPWGLTGHQRIGAVFSNKDYSTLDQDARFRGPLATIRAIRSFVTDPKTRPDDWAFYYNFDQYLYTEEDDPTQGFGVFGRFGWSSGEANPIEQFYSIGLGGKGMIPERDNDSYGIAYYYLNASDDLPELLGITAEQGIEMYYNIQVTPWMQITPDLQILIDPGGSDDNDTAIVAGTRMHLIF